MAFHPCLCVQLFYIYFTPPANITVDTCSTLMWADHVKQVDDDDDDDDITDDDITDDDITGG